MGRLLPALTARATKLLKGERRHLHDCGVVFGVFSLDQKQLRVQEAINALVHWLLVGKFFVVLWLLAAFGVLHLSEVRLCFDGAWRQGRCEQGSVALFIICVLFLGCLCCDVHTHDATKFVYCSGHSRNFFLTMIIF